MPTSSGLGLAACQTHRNDLRDLPYLVAHVVSVHEGQCLYKLALRYRSFLASEAPVRREKLETHDATGRGSARPEAFARKPHFVTKSKDMC